MTITAASKKPGTGMMTAGLVIAGIALMLVLLAFNSGGAPTVYVWGAMVIGAALAVIGFAKRILAAVERR